MYRGEWHCGERRGAAIEEDNHANTYFGEFWGHLAHGHGVLVASDQTDHAGSFQRGNAHGLLVSSVAGIREYVECDHGSLNSSLSADEHLVHSEQFAAAITLAEAAKAPPRNIYVRARVCVL